MSERSTPTPSVLAAQLQDAVDRRTPIERLTVAYPELDGATAYETQWEIVQGRVARGEQIIGLKLGLTSVAKQRTMGVEEPIYGWLTSGMLLEASRPLPVQRFIHPRVEPEIAFVIGRELRGAVSVSQVLAATEGVCAALEVIDSRYADFSFRHPDVVADNASAAGLIVGPRLRPATELEDLSLLGCVLRRNGEVVDTATGAAVMGHPAAAIAWLSAQLDGVGRSIPAGALVLAGALTDAIALEPGMTVSAQLAGLGTIEVSG